MFKFLLLLIFLYSLLIFKRKKLDFFYFLVGSIGFFMIVLFLFKDFLIVAMIKFITNCMGIIGELTNGWVGYPNYGIIFIKNGAETISLNIDYECSGFIECLVYVSLSLFFPIFNFFERIKNLIFGCIYILLANIIRLVFICSSIYILGNDFYFMAHSIIGRLIFFLLMLFLYFFSFTKPQIEKQKVGNFDY